MEPGDGTTKDRAQMLRDAREHYLRDVPRELARECERQRGARIALLRAEVDALENSDWLDFAFEHQIKVVWEGQSAILECDPLERPGSWRVTTLDGRGNETSSCDVHSREFATPCHVLECRRGDRTDADRAAKSCACKVCKCPRGPEPEWIWWICQWCRDGDHWDSLSEVRVVDPTKPKANAR